MDSEDTQVMIKALKQLGVQINSDWVSNQVTVIGNNGPFIHQKKQILDLGNAGTALRPLAATLSASRGEYVLDGTSRMRERPIGDLVDGLRQLGVEISCSATGCPPVHIHAKGMAAGTVEISGKTSSQFVSALLLASPLCSDAGEVTVKISNELISAPYVSMTIHLMKQFHVHVRTYDHNSKTYTIPAQQRYASPSRLFVEGDASSASYFLAGGAITGGPVMVRGCGGTSIQGDTRFAHILQKMGASVTWTANSITVQRDVPTSPLVAIDEDCGDIPDVAMTLAIVAVFCTGVTRLRHLGSWRLKETQRMEAMVTELRRIGVR
ncbi:3-phosphoshikimate 1-carboxyvinyltransferase, partial [archaeon]